MMAAAVRLEGCVPIRAYWAGGEPMVDWCHLANARFREPFFEETIGPLIRRPANLLFRPQTPLDVAEAWIGDHPPVPPAGFIFHMSRCGSTLLSQMLAASPRNIVISEALPIDMALRPDVGPSGLDDAMRARLLRAIVGGLGQRRFEGEGRLFIKFDCWHTLYLDLIRAAFPTVPWLFLYRDPVEVLVSQIRKRGVQTVPGMIRPELFGIDFAAAVQMPAPEYCAKALAAICQAALDRGRTGEGLLVNYSELPEAAWSRIPAHFGTAWTADERQAMAKVLKFDAKAPSFAFEPDAAAKRSSAPDALRAAAAQWLEPVYRALETERSDRDGFSRS